MFDRLTTRLFNFLGSFTFAVILLCLLFVLTLFGTLDQRHTALFDVQKKYFESLIILDSPIWIPLPGAYLVLSLLALNLLVGGVIRMKRTVSRVGIFIIHGGIALLLLGGLIEFQTSRKGNVTLFEGQSASEFKSYFEWEVVVTEQLPEGRERAFVIPHEQFADMDSGETRRFSSKQLPFAVHLAGFIKNCRPARAAAGSGVDGIVFMRHPDEMEAERNAAGVGVTLVEPNGRRHQGLLWGWQNNPWVVQAGGKTWAVDMRKRSWELPYQITLKKFTRELHPGTGMAARFASDITRTENHVAQDVHISMNEPMRHAGFTFYQSGWNEINGRLTSTFSVVENPADRIPEISCWIIGIGLLIHFGRKLWLHILAEQRRQVA